MVMLFHILKVIALKKGRCDLKKVKQNKGLEGFDFLVKKTNEMLPLLEKDLAANLREKQQIDEKIDNITKQIAALKKFLGVNGINPPAKRGRKSNLSFEKDSDGLTPITGKKLMENIYQILKEHGPLHNKEILNYLYEKGFKVAGSNPVTNYFSHLSRDKRITGTGRRGEYMATPDNNIQSDII